MPRSKQRLRSAKSSPTTSTPLVSMVRRSWTSSTVGDQPSTNSRRMPTRRELSSTPRLSTRRRTIFVPIWKRRDYQTQTSNHSSIVLNSTRIWTQSRGKLGSWMPFSRVEMMSSHARSLNSVCISMVSITWLQTKGRPSWKRWPTQIPIFNL